MIASIFAIAISGRYPLNKRIDIYSKGASTDNMMMMLWIFVLAGAFANSAKEMGSIDATVNLTLSILPDNMLLAGFFLAACFISISIGTSVGTIVALSPYRLQEWLLRRGTPLPFCRRSSRWWLVLLAITCRSSATQRWSQHVHKSAEWRINSRVNFFICSPLQQSFILIAYIFLGTDIHLLHQAGSIDIQKIIPYMAVLICAVLGMNVMAVLTIGILLTGCHRHS